MCGIAGSFGKVTPNSAQISSTLEVLARRGPDDAGSFLGELRGRRMSLLHTRLAIIDLDPRSNQPFVADDCVLVFNGEIYNYLELRQSLIALGHAFDTGSDTEVIIRAYRAWGPGCVERFEGMWAFALLDSRTDTLVLSRDRFGEKPLYFTHHDGTLYFASEIKALVALSGRTPAVNGKQVRRYLVNGYRALYKNAEAYFESVSEFPPAGLAVIHKPDEIPIQTYWRLNFAPRPMERRDAVDGVRARLMKSMEIRLRADVPIAFCLSGGIDSNALVAIAAQCLGYPVHAFSVIDSDPRYDESANIGAAVEALGCRHDTVRTSRRGFFERMQALIDYHDAPVATISYYVHAFLSEAIHGHGYKIAVSGTGADELFTGYYDHYAFWLAEMGGHPDYARLLEDWRQGYGTHVRNPLLKDPGVFARNPGQRDHLTLDRALFDGMLIEPLDEEFTEETFHENVLRNRMLNELAHEVVPVILHEDDRNSMRVSIENRSPYLDRELAEFAFSVPNEHLVRNGLLKWLLRSATKGLVPERIRLDRQKRGFNASITSLVDPKDRNTRERLLERSAIFEIVNREAFTSFLDTDMTPNSRSKFLFSFISAKLFLESDRALGRLPAMNAA